jgi:hypothetical protein
LLFKKINDDSKFELSKYVKEYIELNKSHDIKVYLGTDSQNKSNRTTYATTIVFHIGNTGCHVIYSKENVPLISVSNYWDRLWGEVERSVEVALYLRKNGVEVHSIGLDLNSDPNTKSNKLVRSAVGYVEGLGFIAKIKPDMLPSIKAADDLAR